MKKKTIIFHIDLLGQKSAFLILETDYLYKKVYSYYYKIKVNI